jgi:hypothetical protein
MSNAIDKLKKMHSAVSIESKDFSLKEIFAGKETEAVLIVTGLASKFVPKYHSDSNYGYHTMIYLIDGKKTGAFSNALYEFAKFFYIGAQLDPNAEFNKIMFTDGFIQVRVSKVDLGKGKTTYNFEILDGEVDKIERIGLNNQGNNIFEITEGLAALPGETMSQYVVDPAAEEAAAATEENTNKSKK